MTRPEHARALVRAIAGAARTDVSLAHVSFRFLSPRRDVVDAMQDELGDDLGGRLRITPDFEGAGELETTTEIGARDVSTGLCPGRTWTRFVNDVVALTAARDAGQLDSVIVWTFDRPQQVIELIFAEVDGIMTNDPATLRRLRDDATIRNGG
jgi:hypothetical protein